MTDSLAPIPQTSQPATEWDVFADLILGILREPAYRGWATIDIPGHDAARMPAPARKMSDRRTARDRDPEPCTEDPSDVDAMLDKVEREGMRECLPPCSETVPARTPQRPRVAAVLATLRLAETFGRPDAFRAAIAPPGDTTLLSGVPADLRDLVEQVLDVMPSRLIQVITLTPPSARRARR